MSDIALDGRCFDENSFFLTLQLLKDIINVVVLRELWKVIGHVLPDQGGDEAELSFVRFPVVIKVLLAC